MTRNTVRRVCFTLSSVSYFLLLEQAVQTALNESSAELPAYCGYSQASVGTGGRECVSLPA